MTSEDLESATMADTDPPTHEHDHATGGPSRLCPLCLLIDAASDLRPEVRTHLRAAGRELALALKAALDDLGPPSEADERSGLRRIDLDPQ
jgi:hypothetical protein